MNAATVKHQFIFLRETWRMFNRNWVIGTTNKFILLLFVLSIVFLLWRWQFLPPQVPLWYSKPWGVDRLAPPVLLFLLPLGALLVYGVNVMLSAYVSASYLVFTQILYLTSLFVSALSFFALLKILFLIT